MAAARLAPGLASPEEQRVLEALPEPPGRGPTERVDIPRPPRRIVVVDAVAISKKLIVHIPLFSRFSQLFRGHLTFCHTDRGGFFAPTDSLPYALFAKQLKGGPVLKIQLECDHAGFSIQIQSVEPNRIPVLFA